MNHNNYKTCIVIGEGNLPFRCMEILKDHGIKITALISKDSWLIQKNEAQDFPKYDKINDLTTFEPIDFIFSINNSIILKKSFTSLAKVMTINYHDALLPRYAGMYATNWAIINNETEHGVSWHEVVDEIDAGDIFASEMVPVMPNDTALSLNTRCFEAAIKSFENLITSIIEERLIRVPQNLDNRTYFPYAARPESFGLISYNSSAKSIDSLIRGTYFGKHYDNEFTIPLLSVHNEIYMVAQSWVDFNHKGTPGLIDEIEGKRGFYCLDGIVFPKIIYNSFGEIVDIIRVLENGSKLTLPDREIASKALQHFGSMAKFESYWRKQLAVAEFINWPISQDDKTPTIAQIIPEQNIIDQFNTLFPDEKTEDLYVAALLIFFVRLSNQSTGTLGFVSAQLPIDNDGYKDFFNTWVPLNGAIDDSKDILSEIRKMLSDIKKGENSKTFTRSTRIRYPELQNNASDVPEIILSKAHEKYNTLNSKSITINITKSNIQFNKPIDSPFTGINSIAESFKMFLQHVVESPGNSAKDIPLVSEKESLKIVKIQNIEICQPVVVEDVVTQFNSIVERFPEQSVIFDHGKTYNYATFSKDIQNLSIHLIERGITSDQIVAVEIGRNYNYFVSIMAILRCGATFLPIDPTQPTDRKRFFCEDAKVSLILVDDISTETVTTLPTLNLAELNQKWDDSNLPNIEYSPESIAYIIYTSGSTGVPKGVKISRKALANFISGALGVYQINIKDHILQFSNLAFDASIEEIFTAFTSGATIYLRTSEMLMADELISFSHKHQITIWDLPTAFWRQVIQSGTYNSKTLPESLRLVIIGGEAITTQDVMLWNKVETKHQLFNTYGPTETTVVALAYEIKKGFQPKTSVPIGQPLPGYKLYITNSNRQIVPLGISGELLIAGDSISTGYLNRESEQNKAFIWFKTPDNGLQRCYCTGDLVSASADGTIYYQGRVDAQVKIRGYRVEPGEIEKQIESIEGINSCVVAVSTNNDGNKSLFAFYIGNDPESNPQKIKEELKKKVPSYMIPEIIIKIDEVPLTKNGKIDKKNLITLAKNQQTVSKGEQIQPTNPNEQFMLNLWKEILSIESMGIDDDFFDLGGHSLKAVALMSEIKRLKGINIPLASLIQNSTVRTFAPLLLSNKNEYLWECLVPIRPSGTKHPLFLIHGAGLNILLYQSLSHYLKEDRPIYAFQAKGLDGSCDISNDIEEMASDYIDEIKKIQPNGPYLLLGFSLGGFIAYDMAKKLTNNGSDVRFLGVIDSVSSMANHIQSPLCQKLFNIKVSIIKPFYVLWLILKEPMSGKRQFLRNKYKSVRFSIYFKLIKLGIIKDIERKIPIEGGKPMFLSDNVEIAMTEALLKYKIIPSPVQLDLFRAGKSTFYIPNKKDYGWGRFAEKGVVVHTLTSEHSKIFAPPNDKYFAKLLDKRLDEIETKGISDK